MKDIAEVVIDKKIECIFIDFWDTIVHRTRHTEEIKMEICKKIIAYYNLGFSVYELYKLRGSLEKHLNERREEYSFAELITLMYSAINSSGLRGSITDCEQKFIENVSNWEKEEELKCVVPDKETITWVRKQRVPVYVVSDFYFGKEYLVSILEKIGFDKDIKDIFVSCDYGCRKQSGKLYLQVMERLQYSANTIMMIGDNHYVDYKVPCTLGMNAYHKKYTDDNTLITVDKVKGDILNHCRGLCKAGEPLVAHVYTLYYFVEKIYKELKKRSVKDVFFLSREGELLKLLFEQYQRIINEEEKICTHYLCVSRVSTFLPSFRELKEEDFGIISKQFREISYRQFFKIVGLEEEMMNEGNMQLLLKDDVISDWFVFCDELRQNNEFSNIYETKRIEQKRLFIKYLEQSGVDIYGNGLSLVDIGWKGTMQDNISNIYENEITIHGYYLGITEPGDALPQSYKKGLVFEKVPVESVDYATWSENIIQYERILMASHGSTSCYKMVENQVEPVFDDNAIDVDNYIKFQPSREEIIREFEKIAICLKESFLSTDELYSVFLECRKMGLFYKSKETVQFERYLEKNIYENTGGQLFNVEKKTYIGYIKKIVKKVKYKHITLARGIWIEVLSYFCKVKGLMGCSAFFSRCYYRCIKNGGK